MANYCLLPRKCQKEFAAYMATQYGVDYSYRYLAVVTNPKPNPASKNPNQKPKKKKLTPQAVEA